MRRHNDPNPPNYLQATKFRLGDHLFLSDNHETQRDPSDSNRTGPIKLTNAYYTIDDGRHFNCQRSACFMLCRIQTSISRTFPHISLQNCGIPSFIISHEFSNLHSYIQFWFYIIRFLSYYSTDINAVFFFFFFCIL